MNAKELKAAGLTKTDFQRELDLLPMPEDIKCYRQGGQFKGRQEVKHNKKTVYGQFLRRTRPEEFNKLYDKWLKERIKI